MNPYQVRKLFEGREAWAAWREKNPEIIPDLSRADLAGACLGGSDLSGANLEGADLTKANLTLANLEGADLTKAILSGACLAGVDLTSAILDGADMTGADLYHANLPKGQKGGIVKAQKAYEQRSQYYFCSGNDLREFFGEVLGDPSPSGKEEISFDDYVSFMTDCIYAQCVNGLSGYWEDVLGNLPPYNQALRIAVIKALNEYKLQEVKR